MLSVSIIVGFFLMLFAPCAFAAISSRDRKESRGAGPAPLASSWRVPKSSSAQDLDLVRPAEARQADARQSDPAPARPKTPQAPSASPTVAQRSRGASTLLGLAAEAEADSLAAQIYAAQASKAALAAAARAAAARAAAATALAADAERAVAEAARLAAAVRRAYETAPASVGPVRHALPETHPSMDFPRSHVHRRAA